MPLILTERNPEFGNTYLWNVTEEVSFFKEALESTPMQIDHIAAWHPKRQKEWMSGRFLIDQYMDEDLALLTVDAHGKPSFRDSEYHFSISHTDGLVGLQYHHHPIGLDLQIKTDKIHRVAHKFCTANDYDILSLHFDKKETERIIWSLKEAVYKAYGKGRLSYQNHIILQELDVTNTSTSVKVKIANDSIELIYTGKISIIGPYCMSQVCLATT